MGSTILDRQLRYEVIMGLDLDFHPGGSMQC